LVSARCIKAVGPAPVAGQKLKNCLLSQTVTGLSTAGIVISKEKAAVLKGDSKAGSCPN